MSQVDQKSVATVMDIPLEVTIPVSKILPWVIFGGLAFTLAFYFVGAEQGATHLISGMGIHEFVHDARHLLGFPCH